MKSGARWPFRRVSPWISIVDPDGLVHVVGDITPSHDFTECRQEIVKGWYATKRHRLRTPFCAPCRLAARRHRLSRVRLTQPPSTTFVQTSGNTNPSTITFHDNKFGGETR